MKALVTGARGFIGRNLVARLRAAPDCTVLTFDRGDSCQALRGMLNAADIVFHLAGINRAGTNAEFENGNAGLTRTICHMLAELGASPLVVFTSSIQAALPNPYGESKLLAESELRELSYRTGTRIRIYRLKNVFGKWCRPNYNSVVATFCYNMANDLGIQISNPDRQIELVYIDDVTTALMSNIGNGSEAQAEEDIPSVRLSLSELAGRIQSLRDIQTSLIVPDFATEFNRQLYGTYLSYVSAQHLCSELMQKADQRGMLAEFIKSSHVGQIFVSRTKPGIVRGNHYHHAKAEKFLVLEGEALIRMRRIDDLEVAEYRVHGADCKVIDIPPGHAHSIENIGRGEMVTLFWASEVFNPDCPDTYFCPVLVPSNALFSSTAVR